MLELCRSLCQPHARRLATRLFTTSTESTAKRPRYGAAQVSTFDPHSLRPSDYVDISNRSEARITSDTAGRAPTRVLYSGSRSNVRQRFPPNSRGFFYLYRPPSTYQVGAQDIFIPAHVAASQLRFRLVDTPDPGAFSTGTDLALSRDRTGEPWSLPLLAIRKAPFGYHDLYHRLTTAPERSEIDAFMHNSRTLHPDKHAEACNKQTTFLASVLEPFVLDFGKCNVAMYLLDPDCVAWFGRAHMFTTRIKMPASTTTGTSDGPRARYPKSPYSGRAYCRFELVQKALRDDDSGPITKYRDHLAIRVLRWIERPLLPDGVNGDTPPVQKEGELLQKFDVGRGSAKVWFSKTVKEIPPASLEILRRAYPDPLVLSGNLALAKT